MKHAKYLSAISLLLAALLACSGTGLASAPTYEGPGWATAEDAVTAYLEAMQRGDLSAMVSAFAIETYVDNYDFAAQLKRLSAYSFVSIIKVPNTNELFRSINIEARQGEAVMAVLLQMLTLHMPDRDFMSMLAFKTDTIDADVGAFVEEFAENTGSLSLETLTFGRFIPPESLSDVYESEMNQANIDRQKAIYGADEQKSVVAVFSVGSTLCALCCDAVRYGEKWYLLSMGGNIGNILGLRYSSGGITAADIF